MLSSSLYSIFSHNTERSENEKYRVKIDSEVQILILSIVSNPFWMQEAGRMDVFNKEVLMLQLNTVFYFAV